MNHGEFLSFHADFCARMLEIAKAKNADYTGNANNGGDAFKNFCMVDALDIASVEQGFLTRMTDKLCRISALTKGEAQVADESINDTLMDLANYSILMAGYLQSKKTATTTTQGWATISPDETPHKPQTFTRP